MVEDQGIFDLSYIVIVSLEPKRGIEPPQADYKTAALPLCY
jgi:hypothetical protein